QAGLAINDALRTVCGEFLLLFLFCGKGPFKRILLFECSAKAMRLVKLWSLYMDGISIGPNGDRHDMQMGVARVIVSIGHVRLVFKSHPGHIPVCKLRHCFITQQFPFAKVQRNVKPIFIISFVQRSPLTKPFGDVPPAQMILILEKICRLDHFGFSLGYFVFVILKSGYGVFFQDVWLHRSMTCIRCFWIDDTFCSNISFSETDKVSIDAKSRSSFIRPTAISIKSSREWFR